MSNSYHVAAAFDTLRLTKEQMDELNQLLREPNQDDITSGLSVQGEPEEAVIASFDGADYNPEAFGEAALRFIGERLKEQGRESLLFGVAAWSDKMRLQSCGGRYFRVTSAGRLEEPELKWPS